jgi:hypothetical protein
VHEDDVLGRAWDERDFLGRSRWRARGWRGRRHGLHLDQRTERRRTSSRRRSAGLAADRIRGSSCAARSSPARTVPAARTARSTTSASEAARSSIDRLIEEGETVVATGGGSFGEKERRARANRDGSYAEPTKQTVSDYLQREWLPAVPSTVRPLTAADDERVVRLHLLPHLGALRLQSVSGAHLRTRLAAGSRRTASRRGPGATSTPSFTVPCAMPSGGMLTRSPADRADAPRRGRSRVTRRCSSATSPPAPTTTTSSFCNELGQPVLPDCLSALFRAHRTAAGISTGSLHVLRHTAATLALTSGVPVHIVAARHGDDPRRSCRPTPTYCLQVTK